MTNGPSLGFSTQQNTSFIIYSIQCDTQIQKSWPPACIQGKIGVLTLHPALFGKQQILSYMGSLTLLSVLARYCVPLRLASAGYLRCRYAASSLIASVITYKQQSTNTLSEDMSILSSFNQGLISQNCKKHK